MTDDIVDDNCPTYFGNMTYETPEWYGYNYNTTFRGHFKNCHEKFEECIKAIQYIEGIISYFRETKTDYTNKTLEDTMHWYFIVNNFNCPMYEQLIINYIIGVHGICKPFTLHLYD